MSQTQQSLLGKPTTYKSVYDASLLFPIARQEKRDELGFNLSNLPFHGIDIWTAFEVSWLDANGKPEVRIAEFEFDAASPNLIESKSFKLYLNSFNGTQFEDEAAVHAALSHDLSAASGKSVKVALNPLHNLTLIGAPEGQCLDTQVIDIHQYELAPQLLSAQANQPVSKQVFSHLLKSNCLVTGQPDWGTIVIQYQGNEIDPTSLLRYLVSYRNHMEFHEQCVERVFCDLMRLCQPEKLLVYARYVRRGGLDINPYRANFDVTFDKRRLVRQ